MSCNRVVDLFALDCGRRAFSGRPPVKRRVHHRRPSKTGRRCPRASVRLHRRHALRDRRAPPRRFAALVDCVFAGLCRFNPVWKIAPRRATWASSAHMLLLLLRRPYRLTGIGRIPLDLGEN